MLTNCPRTQLILGVDFSNTVIFPFQQDCISSIHSFRIQVNKYLQISIGSCFNLLGAADSWDLPCRENYDEDTAYQTNFQIQFD